MMMEHYDRSEFQFTGTPRRPRKPGRAFDLMVWHRSTIHRGALMRPRRGMTLVELLVVIGILAVLAGLVVPAVQNARASAARIGCANNLEQVGLALHQYHDVHKSFPAGFTSARNPLAMTTWLTRILPFIEQD